jgi:thiamine biosynthesis lipoprotein
MRPEETAGVGLGEASAEIEAHRFAHEAMATVFEVICAHDDPGYAGQAARDAFDLVDRLERELSRFRASSDVSRINALAAGQKTRVSPETLECLEIARRMYGLTGGVFDISLGTGLEQLELVADGFFVRAREDRVRLDLGGIGKGYAVDRMTERLEEWEVPRALLHGGFSSVRAMDAPPGREGWPLTLTAPGPGDDRERIRISARHRALSASGTQKGTHIVDPRTGRPAGPRAAWATLPCPGTDAEVEGAWVDVLRSPAAVAEALSTAFMVLSLNEIEELCDRGPGLEAWVFQEGVGPGEPALVHLPHPGPAGRAVE